MGYRILCDEHVEPETGAYLDDYGHDAVHVRDVLHLGAPDDELAEYARETDRVLLTNDRGFLDENAYPDLTVLCYTDNRASAYDLATLVEDATAYFPTQDDLPRVCYLNE